MAFYTVKQFQANSQLVQSCILTKWYLKDLGGVLFICSYDISKYCLFLSCLFNTIEEQRGKETIVVYGYVLSTHTAIHSQS